MVVPMSSSYTDAFHHKNGVEGGVNSKTLFASAITNQKEGIGGQHEEHPAFSLLVRIALLSS